MFEVNHIEIKDKNLPEAFDNTVIVQVSDLHSANYGKNQKDLLKAIKASKPDMIAVTGDIIDERYNDIDIAMDFINGAVRIAPTFYVTGNHEAWTKLYIKLEKALIEAGVILLRDKIIELKKNNQSISLIGLDDPAFSKNQETSFIFSKIQDKIYSLLGRETHYYTNNTNSYQEEGTSVFDLQKVSLSIKETETNIINNEGTISLKPSINSLDRPLTFGEKVHLLMGESENYSILLSHRPEFFKDFVNAKANLVLTGHTHGGQVRFPLLGNIYSPHQGLFPKYSDGIYEKDQTKMFISRGLGNSGLPFRLNNPPELIVFNLKKL